MVAGVALALMETISDFGTVEYFAIETLTLGIFNVWLGMNSLPGAAQIAVFAFLFVIVLLVLEAYTRGRRHYSETGRRYASLTPIRTSGLHAGVCAGICAAPVVLGFVIPVVILLGFVIQGYSIDNYAKVVEVALNSLLIAVSVAVMVMAAATVMTVEGIFHNNRLVRALTALASTGYAFPGTILAIGVVT